MDNTVLNSGAGGDTVRDLARTGGTVKTQVVQLDLGGPSANAEALITAGRQLMSASVPVAIALDQPALPVTVSPANNQWGQSLSQTALSTATLTRIAVSPAGYQIKGFIGHGTGDGYFVVSVNYVTVLSGRTRSTLPVLPITLPNGISVTAGSLVMLQVTNESGSTADYEATLLGA